MGLTIHYRLTLSRDHPEPAADVVRRLNALAAKRDPAESGVQVLPSTSDLAELGRWGGAFLTRPDPREPDTIRGIEVPPLEGCLFPVAVGQDCEFLWLGLCRYPATVGLGDSEVATGLDSGWRFSGACKTQYASLHGWNHFHRCHTTVVQLLRMAEEVGVHVRITDEGGWWPGESDLNLRHMLDTYNQATAALAGALKDASTEGKPDFVAPILTHPEFERLEADGVAQKGRSVEEALRAIAKERRRPRPEAGSS